MPKAPAVITESAVSRTRAELVRWWFRPEGVWDWLTGVDPTTHTVPFLPDHEFPNGVPIIWTTDEKDNESPVKPFPAHLDYLKLYVETIVSVAPEDKIIFIDKSRQMLASTGALLAFDWMCRSKEARRILWSKLSEDQAAEMLEDKVRAVHARLPEWLREASPQKDKPRKKVRYTATNSYIQAVNQDTAKGAARGGTASAIGVDEAAFQDQFEAIFDAAMPMAAKLVALTTAASGPPGAMFFYGKISEGRVYRRPTPIDAPVEA